MKYYKVFVPKAFIPRHSPWESPAPSSKAGHPGLPTSAGSQRGQQKNRYHPSPRVPNPYILPESPDSREASTHSSGLKLHLLFSPVDI